MYELFEFFCYIADEPQAQQSEGDAWNSGWGDEDNLNLQAVSTNFQTENTSLKPENPKEMPQAAANNISESFSNDHTWNWSVEEAKNSGAHRNFEPAAKLNSEQPTKENLFLQMGKLAENHNAMSNENLQENLEPQQPQIENVDVPSFENLPSGVTGKHAKLSDLTPQWSMESQVSQDSSEDILPTSESDKSKIISRSSTVSQSPISGQEFHFDSVSTEHMGQLPEVKEEKVLFYLIFFKC